MRPLFLLIVSIVLLAPAFAQPPEPNNDPATGAAKRGALSGASIFVSPGHGWYYHPVNGWLTQRGNSHGVVEDHSNAEAVIQYLLPYLENAGARVYVARERDMQTNMVIVTPGGPGHSEKGEWDSVEVEGTWNNTPLRFIRAVSGPETASATYTPDIPEEGFYAVYAWFREHPKRRTATDARFVINHTGGTTVWQQDLNRDGHTWKYLGTYWFEKGVSDVRGSVVVANQSANGGEMIVAPTLRFGGGVGDMSVAVNALYENYPTEPPPPSGKPRWEESGHTYSIFMGLDPARDSRRFNQVWAMPLWAEWESEAWEAPASVYLSWHTNASVDHQVRGLSTYIYGIHGWGPHEDFSGFPGSVELANAVHDRVIHVMRSDWDPAWEDVGKVTRWLGETNPRGNNKMPALLVENGFHDNPEDAAAILEPAFRRAGAKAIMQGLIDYYADHVPGFDNSTYPPETPTNLRIATNLRGEVTIAWDAPPYDAENSNTLGHRATGYRVYRSLNGRGFDNGFDVKETSWRPRVLIPGEVAHYRVTALNAGGESLPTETLAVRLSRRDRPEILVVNGFDRLDRGLNIVLEDGVERGILSRMNTFDSIIPHGVALALAGEDFDSASNEAVIASQVELKNYNLVVWMLGRESTKDRTFDEREQQLVRAYIEQGGKLIASGTDTARDLAATPDGAQFLEDIFGATHAGTSTGTHTARGPLFNVISDGDSFTFEDGSGPGYPVLAPDVLSPVAGAETLLTFVGGTADGQPAAVASAHAILFTIPLDSIPDDTARHNLLRAAILRLLGQAEGTDVTLAR
jgi:N-acetylmuramoyl-L-alanine amidase